MYKSASLVVSNPKESDKYEEIIQYIDETYKIKPDILSYTDILKAENEYSAKIYMLYVSDDDIKLFLKNNLKFNINIAILPEPTSTHALKVYDISRDIHDAIDDGFNETLLSKVDILKCNDIIVFNRAIIGDMHGMNRFDFSESSFFKKIQSFFQNLKTLQFKNYTLSLSEDKKIQTVASGITILEQSFTDTKSKVDEMLSMHDGRLNAFILAPTSLLAYLWYLILMFVYQKISMGALPDGLGYIKSSKLTISSPEPIELMIDDNLVCAKELEFIVDKEVLNLHLGRTLEQHIKKEKEVENNSTQDIINVKTLPQKDLEDVLIGGKLPFFKKASEEEFKSLFVGLRSSAEFSSVFIVLMILSTLLATTGLFANSAPVIIGAMVLAPLMSPIVSFAMGIIRNDTSLIYKSTKTLFIGILMAILFSSLFTLIMPLKEITPEMASRLHPNLLDLMVAIFSGIAGAYATSKEEVAKSLAGVAIAVALVPPLSVTGIGVGMFNLDVIYGSFLLFTTNLVGITLSAALTFIVLGYAPVHRATKAIVYTSIMLVAISIPLVFSFIDLVEKNNYFTQLKSLKNIELNKNKLELEILNINTENEKVSIEMNIFSSEMVSSKELHELKNILEHKINKTIILKANTEIIIK